MLILREVLQTILDQVPETDGCELLMLQEGDDLKRDFPMAGRQGLLTHLDDCWQEPFAWVRVVTVGSCRVYVAKLAKSYRKGDHVVIVPTDAHWVDERLRLVLSIEVEE